MEGLQEVALPRASALASLEQLSATTRLRSLTVDCDEFWWEEDGMCVAELARWLLSHPQPPATRLLSVMRYMRAAFEGAVAAARQRNPQLQLAVELQDWVPQED